MLLLLLSISGLICRIVEGVGTDYSPVIQVANLGLSTSKVSLDLPSGGHHHLVSAEKLVAIVDLEASSLCDHAIRLDSPTRRKVSSPLATTRSHHLLL